MQIPLDFYNVSLWFAVTGLILFITAQLASAYDGNATIFIDQRKLKNTAIVIGALFLVTVAMRICGIITST
jgi:hypothetical protein